MIIKQKWKKSIYLISGNKPEFNDLTLKAIKIISTSDCVVISKKFSANYLAKLNKFCKKIYHEEDIVDCTSIELYKKIHLLFNKNNDICHITNSSSLMLKKNLDERNFFLKKGINVVLISGIIELIQILNDLKTPLTDRRKNSSVTFLEIFKKNDLNFNLNNIFFEKLIIKVNDQKYLDDINKKLTTYIKKIKINYLITNTKSRSKTSKGDQKIKKNDQNDTNYIILEKNE